MKHVALIGLLAACGTTESSSLLTSGISAEMAAVATGNGTTRVTAELFNGSPNQLIFVDLQADDALVADHAGASMRMHKTQLLTIIDYEAVFQSGAQGDQFQVDFQRTIDGGAPTSTATLPAPFTIDPVASSYSRGAAITMTYGPAGSADTMGWQASGDCIQVVTGAVTGDPGTITIPASTLMGTAGATSCTVTLSITRDHGGTLDPGFGKGGNIIGEQVRTAIMTSTP